MDKITDTTYREYLEKRLKVLTNLADIQRMSVENMLRVQEQMDYVMFQLYQLDNAEPEE